MGDGGQPSAHPLCAVSAGNPCLPLASFLSILGEINDLLNTYNTLV